ncbi:hypothetical protein ACQ4PT_054194 [Festuca glaucescens]
MYGLEGKRELIDKYMDRTLSTAIKNGVSGTINRNLVSFAADLIKSDYTQDHIDAVLVMHTLTSQESHRTSTLFQIQSSPLCVSRLLDMLSSKSRTDQRTKIRIAEIVAHLASNLRLADISGATESISSMIDPYFKKISTVDTNASILLQIAIGIRNNQQESKYLIIHGLSILAKLAINPDNCKQMYDYKGLFSKIMSPVKNKVYEIPDVYAIEITEKALEVVSMLVSGTDETSGKIRQDICRNGIAVNNIRSILEMEGIMYTKIKVPATKILVELYLDISTRANIANIAAIIHILMNIFFNANNESGLTKTAGTALARLAMNNDNCKTIMDFNKEGQTSVQLLIAMINGADHILYPTNVAQLLMQLCANSNTDAERARLTSVKTILHEVLKVTCNVGQIANVNQAGPPHHNQGQQQAANANQGAPPQHNMGQPAANANQADPPQHNPGQPPLQAQAPVGPQLVGGRIKSLATFLGLGLQICKKLAISAAEFDIALANIPLSMGNFVEKLNDIIEECKGHSVDSLDGKAPSVDYLIIIKTVTNLCEWMMHTKPDCITYFQNKGTRIKLQHALKDMIELELGMLLNGSAGAMENYQTLSTMVAAAGQIMEPNVHQIQHGVAPGPAAPGPAAPGV